MASDPYFLDRKDAGSKLIPFIDHHINFNTLIIAIPRGGVSVAEPIAEHFKLPIHLLMIKKISHPDNKELAIGACGLTEYVLDDQGLLNEKELEVTISSLREKLESRQKSFQQRLFPLIYRQKRRC
jgi:putative phosphoribosyl transferase